MDCLKTSHLELLSESFLLRPLLHFVLIISLWSIQNRAEGLSTFALVSSLLFNTFCSLRLQI